MSVRRYILQHLIVIILFRYTLESGNQSEQVSSAHSQSGQRWCAARYSIHSFLLGPPNKFGAQLLDSFSPASNLEKIFVLTSETLPFLLPEMQDYFAIFLFYFFGQLFFLSCLLFNITSYSFMLLFFHVTSFTKVTIRSLSVLLKCGKGLRV